MVEKDLTSIGFPGYLIREDGALFNKEGRVITGNRHGQVRMQRSPGQGSEWTTMAWLVARAFVAQPKGFTHVVFKDGNKDNLHYTNLDWSPVKRQASPTRARVLQLLVEGWHPDDVAPHVGCTLQYVRSVAAERLKELELRSLSE